MVKFKKKYELPIFLVRERINNPPQTSKLTLSNFCPHFFFAFYLLFWSPPVFSNILRSKSYIKCFWWSCFFSFLYNHLKYTMLNYYKKKSFLIFGVVASFWHDISCIISFWSSVARLIPFLLPSPWWEIITRVHLL